MRLLVFSIKQLLVLQNNDNCAYCLNRLLFPCSKSSLLCINSGKPLLYYQTLIIPGNYHGQVTKFSPRLSYPCGVYYSALYIINCVGGSSKVLRGINLRVAIVMVLKKQDDTS